MWSYFTGLTAKRITEMPIEKLALVTLRDISINATGGMSVDNWARSVRRILKKDRDAMRAVSEALAWLYNSMYLVRDLNVTTEGEWALISRAGKLWMEKSSLPK
ncbi:hypothetical protein OG985_45260 [Streptomyces sp. NBC_00289]|uniref:hypothetical protein n=1 Tax=Streptomyces sp. NBC_00289 TaxID=2975703 RepID=UPI00324CDCDE